MEPTREQMKDMMVVITNSDGTEELSNVNLATWKKTQEGTAYYKENFRLATKAEILSFKRKIGVEDEEEVATDKIEVPEEPPVSIAHPDEDEESEVGENIARKEESVEDKIKAIETYNDMEIFLILECDYEDDMDRNMPLEDLKKMAKELYDKKG